MDLREFLELKANLGLQDWWDRLEIRARQARLALQGHRVFLDRKATAVQLVPLVHQPDVENARLDVQVRRVLRALLEHVVLRDLQDLLEQLVRQVRQVRLDLLVQVDLDPPLLVVWDYLEHQDHLAHLEREVHQDRRVT